MAAPTVRQIREGMGTRLDTISGLRVFSTIPGQFSPPAAIVGMPARVEHETFSRGTHRWDLTVWVVVARQADAQSEKSLEAYLNPTGASSVWAAVWSDRTLNGAVSDTFEIDATPTDFVFGTGDQASRYIGVEFNFFCLAPGKD